MKNRTLKIIILITAIVGSLVSLIGFLVNYAQGFGCKWVWLLSTIGWGMFSAALSDLVNLEEEIKKLSQNNSKEKRK